jgi:hypothetical protein
MVEHGIEPTGSIKFWQIPELQEPTATQERSQLCSWLGYMPWECHHVPLSPDHVASGH